MNTPTEEQWRELLSRVASLENHKIRMRLAILNKNEIGALDAYEEMRRDMNDIYIWFKGCQCANITE